ncbi:tegument protein VP13/14 [Canid alphaherpesvirus 1]|uniref:Tegument protein UL47 n=1 Tax=Canid alphaherpesvirus 1 TaxID=170325 RepID=A0A172DS95_9ALPH|nr:tegument protein VP13/14 [Canid alphaherpesvirus 1]ALL25969.1 tegument protein VP13/14 [Canid alphaherpesvirus 1]ARE29817.1 tegument protein VP13/14 [Canid alphaherpesvirus 1]QQL08500.1 tegument protein VP13/14 [Canid alphaherpesvirus 1]QQL08725.1 tegument protein VP13/14 [Canid alphaherpesvirus 1]
MERDHGFAPIRRPRRSQTRRSHPFYRPEERDVQDFDDNQPSTSGVSRPSGFWDFFRNIFNDDHEQIRPRRPRRDFQPPPNESSSDEEESIQLDEEGAQMYEGEFEVDSEMEDEDLNQDSMEDRDQENLFESNESDHESDREADRIFSEQVERVSEEYEENDSETDDLFEGDYLTPLLRFMESGVRGMAPEIVENAAIEVYKDRFRVGTKGDKTKYNLPNRLLRLLKNGVHDITFYGSFDEEDDPNFNMGEWVNITPTTFVVSPSWDIFVSEYINETNVINPEEIEFNEGDCIHRMRLPIVLKNIVTPEQFLEKFDYMLVALRKISMEDVFADQVSWQKITSLHGFQQFSWFLHNQEYSKGGMYATEAPGVRCIWRRALRQGLALQLQICVAGLTRSKNIYNLFHYSAVNFLLEAAIRSSLNCHLFTRIMFYDYKRLRGAEPPSGSLAMLYEQSIIQPIPSQCAKLFSLSQFYGPADTSKSAIYRNNFGALSYWSDLRLSLGDPVNVNAKYATFHLQTSEVYLFSRANSQNPSFTTEELQCIEAIFSLGTVMLEAAVHWLYLATAHILSDNPKSIIFRKIRSTLFTTHLPLGSRQLSDSEYFILRKPEVVVGRDNTALGQAITLGYSAVRSTLTMLMKDYAILSSLEDKEKTMTCTYLGMTLIIQRLAGHLNLLLLNLAGAAIYGGRKVLIHESTLPRYVLLMDILSPLINQITLVEFWEMRNEVYKMMSLIPMPGPPSQGKKVVLELAIPSEDLDNLTPDTFMNPTNPIGNNMVDLAMSLKSYHQTIIGENHHEELGKKGIQRMRGGVPKKK